MNFTTPLFLFLFLPFFFLIFSVSEAKTRTIIGLVGSALFYSWGQVIYLPLMAGMVIFNYWLGPRLSPQEKGKNRFALLWLGIVSNLLLLLFFKSLVTFGPGWIVDIGLPASERLLSWMSELTFPLGLSYITFQTISYLVDIYNDTCHPAENVWSFSFYIMFFPKILVGPITRFQSVQNQFHNPNVTSEEIADGIRRFVRGLAKKVLIADTIGVLVDAVFVLNPDYIHPKYAWLALIAYSLQIFYDFSGYTDMALGLGQMMGVHLPENFHFPYLAKSIGEFWRRWHISLSNWFRDYVFYPLERRRLKYIGQPINILLVFFLTGLWHGLTPNYIIWGLTHGMFLALESVFLGRLLRKATSPLRHMYTILVLLLTWIFFRAPNPYYAWQYIHKLLGNMDGFRVVPFSDTTPLPFVEPTFWLALCVGVVFIFPIAPYLNTLKQQWIDRFPVLSIPIQAFSDLILLLLLVASMALIANSSFQPAIYGNF